MAYTTTAKIRLLTNLTITDISDADLTAMITEATKQVNSDINVQILREPVWFIDNTRKNTIDGVNATLYVKNWHGKFLADRTNDGTVTIADVVVYQVTSDGTETAPTISSVSDANCSVTMSTAPAADKRYFITYSYSPVRELDGSVDSRVELATTFLTAAYCYARLNIGCAPSVSFGSTRITKDMNSYGHYYQRYLDVIAQINSLEEVHSKVSEDTF